MLATVVLPVECILERLFGFGLVVGNEIQQLHGFNSAATYVILRPLVDQRK